MPKQLSRTTGRAKNGLVVKRHFHPNGQILLEERYRGGDLHGPRRVWHPNGQLAEEERYRDGCLDGECRQWAPDGRLLGSFKVAHGTGIQRRWFEDGTLQLEISTVSGKFTGRRRVWLRYGRLAFEAYSIGNRSVAKAAYLRAVRRDLALPRFEEDGLKALPERVAQEEEYRLHVGCLLGRPDCQEALTWVENDGKRDHHLGSLSPRSAQKLVRVLLELGAMNVTAAGVTSGKKDQEYASWLVVELPESPRERMKIHEHLSTLPRTARATVLPDRWRQERHLLLALG
jgi:hypothetical protein